MTTNAVEEGQAQINAVMATLKKQRDAALGAEVQASVTIATLETKLAASATRISDLEVKLRVAAASYAELEQQIATTADKDSLKAA